MKMLLPIINHIWVSKSLEAKERKKEEKKEKKSIALNGYWIEIGGIGSALGSILNVLPARPLLRSNELFSLSLSLSLFY